MSKNKNKKKSLHGGKQYLVTLAKQLHQSEMSQGNKAQALSCNSVLHTEKKESSPSTKNELAYRKNFAMEKGQKHFLGEHTTTPDSSVGPQVKNSFH